MVSNYRFHFWLTLISAPRLVDRAEKQPRFYFQTVFLNRKLSLRTFPLQHLGSRGAFRRSRLQREPHAGAHVVRCASQTSAFLGSSPLAPTACPIRNHHMIRRPTDTMNPQMWAFSTGLCGPFPRAILKLSCRGRVGSELNRARRFDRWIQFGRLPLKSPVRAREPRGWSLVSASWRRSDKQPCD